MRLAYSYAKPDGWYFEFCTRDDTVLAAAEDIYPDVGCIHQGYEVHNTREVEETVNGKLVKRTITVTHEQALAEVEPKAKAFLAGELARSLPMWEGAKIQEERRLRAQARQRALEEKLLAEERAKLAARP